MGVTNEWVFAIGTNLGHLQLYFSIFVLSVDHDCIVVQ